MTPIEVYSGLSYGDLTREEHAAIFRIRMYHPDGLLAGPAAAVGACARQIGAELRRVRPDLDAEEERCAVMRIHGGYYHLSERERLGSATDVITDLSVAIAAELRRARSCEMTFGMIKPDAVRDSKIGKIIDHILNRDLRIAAMRMMVLSRDQAEFMYDHSRGRDYHDEQVEFMTSGPVVALVLRGRMLVYSRSSSPSPPYQHLGVVERYRFVLGATDPALADPDTIRGRFGNREVKRENAAHGSDSRESAAREIAHFFPELAEDARRGRP